MNLKNNLFNVLTTNVICILMYDLCSSIPIRIFDVSNFFRECQPIVNMIVWPEDQRFGLDKGLYSVNKPFDGNFSFDRFRLNKK